MNISDLSYLEVATEVVEGGAKKGFQVVGDINVKVGVINQLAINNVLSLGKDITTDIFVKQKAGLDL